MRRKSSPFFLLLFEVLFLFLLPHSESSSISFIPSLHQRQTAAPDFNVVATDDGIPVLEPGENPAKDPLVIQDVPDATNTPEPNILPDSTASQNNRPKPQSPASTKFSNPSEEPAIDPEENNDNFGDANSGTSGDDGLSELSASSEFEEEDLPPTGPPSKRPVSGNKEDDVISRPEPSVLPDDPTSSNDSRPGKASDKPIKKKPNGGDSSTKKENDHDNQPEPSQEELGLLTTNDDDTDTGPLPEATSFDDSITPTSLPTPVTPTSQSDIVLPQKPARSDPPELSGTEKKPTPEASPTNNDSNSQGEDDGVDPLNRGFVRPNATYRCVNFAARRLGEYKLFDEGATDGSFTVYKGSGVALNPSLPIPYRYHVYGKNWTYHLDVASDSNHNIILGFAEIFPKACASGRNGSFRVFTVSVGDDFRIVDVMKSSGCGTLQQAIFRNVKPKEQVIDLNFEAISGKAMLSVVCYGASDHTIPKGAPNKSSKADTSESGKNSGSGSSASLTNEFQQQCFTFGEPGISGFTNIDVPELASDVGIYKDESASVVNTDSPDVYKSHIFGSDFTLSIAAGVTHSVTIQLGFAEIYEPGCMLGFRVFKVKAGPELRTIDVFQQAGCSSAFILEIPNILPNANGEIYVSFSSVSNFAMVSSVCIVDKNNAKGSSGVDNSPSLVISSGPKDEEDEEDKEGEDGNEDDNEDDNNGTDSDVDVLLPSAESFPEQSFEAEQDDNDDSVESGLPQRSPYPKENGILVVADPPTNSPDERENPTGSPLPKVNGLIDATLTSSPSPVGDPENDSTETDHSSPEPSDEPSDELLPSDFSQTTVGEGATGEDQSPSPDLLVSPPGQSSGDPASHGASGIGSASLTPSVTATPVDSPDPDPETGDEPALIVPTRTPAPISNSNVSGDEADDGVVDKQGDITIEAPSPSPSLLTVVIEAPTPSTSSVGVAIEGPSSPAPSEEDVTILGPGSEATSTPTPSSISAAAFSPTPNADDPAASPSIPSSGNQPSDITPQPVVTAAVPNTASIEPTAALSPSPSVVPTSTESSPESSPTGVATPQASVSSDLPDGTVILPPVATSPGPQGDPDGSGGGDGALVSPPPSASISQNQIIVEPSASSVASPVETPISASLSPLPQTSSSPDPTGIGPGTGSPDGDIAGSPVPDSSTATPVGSPVPDIVTNPSATAGSSPQATSSPPQTTSSVGSNEVIVDSATTEPSPSPLVSTPIGAPDDGPVQVTDNTTEIIQVTGDDGSETDKEPSILVGEYKDLIATTPAGRGFAIGMGIVGSLLVLLLLVCLFFAIFRGGGAAYSYSSGYSSHKPTDYDPSQGRYTDDLALDPTGYGNVSSRDQSAQEGYGADPVTFESRQEGQSESFGFEMPAAGGLGAPTEEEVRNEEPDTLAEYSSLHLQQPAAHDESLAGLATNDNIRGTRAGQSQPGSYQFTDVQNSYVKERNTNVTYGSIPDEYTFTGTFTIPRTDFRPSQGGSDDRRMDRISRESEEYLQSKPMTADSFNGDHSIARPTNTSESSGKQERSIQNVSGIPQQSTITATVPANVESFSRDGILVDDVRSSLLDSEYESTVSLHSLQSNPVMAPSPYETHQFTEEHATQDSPRITQQTYKFSNEPGGDTQMPQRQLQQMTYQYQKPSASIVPQYQTKQSADIASESHFTAAEAPERSIHQTSSGWNDGPWPTWWARENQRYEKASGYAAHEHGTLKTDGNVVETNQSLSKLESNGPLTPRLSHSRTHQTKLPSELKNASSELKRTLVPDSNWRRQYSSTSDEDESQTEPDPYLEELRRRRQPYVRSVANRLSTGSGSLMITGSGNPTFDKGINRLKVAEIGPDGLGSTPQMSHWISRDPVPV